MSCMRYYIFQIYNSNTMVRINLEEAKYCMYA
jgi:hypothetical protein